MIRAPSRAVTPQPPAPSRQEAINGLIHAIAQREMAVAAMLHAEAERMATMAFTLVRPASFDDVLTFQRSVADLLQALVRKDEALVRKLTAVLELSSDQAPDRP